MNEKTSTDMDYSDEKNGVLKPEPEMADASGRRQSVALNIVENPLKVRITSLYPCPP